MKRFHLPPLIAWTILFSLFFSTLLIGAQRLPSSDLSGQFHAFGLFQAREMAAGRLPVWSPGSYAGIPFAADPQAAVFYPLRWLSILFTLPWGFTFYALQLEGMFHIWLAGVFTYFLAFALTRERLAGLMAAVTFGLGGYLTSYPLLQLAILETIAWLPLILLLVRLGTNSGRPIPWLIGAGIVLGISALAGHPQTFMHVSYLTAAYFLFRTWRARWRWSWSLGIGAGLAVVAVGTSAASWLPAIGYLARSTRSQAAYEFVSAGFPLFDYVQLFVPESLSFWAPQYVGIAAICLTLFAWWERKKQRSHGEIIFWSVAALIAAWISLGDKGVLFELVYRVAPGFSYFRQQERLVSIVSLSLALLAAQGLALWLRANSETRRKRARSIATVFASSLLLVGFSLAMTNAIVAEGWLSVWARQWIIGGIALFLLWRGNELKWRGLALVLLSFADLFLSLRGAMHLETQSPTVFWPQPSWLDEFRSGDLGRVDSGGLFYANVGEIHGLEDIRGLSPLKPQVLADYEQLPLARRWQLLNVTHVVAQAPIEGGLKEVSIIGDGLLPGEDLAASLYRFEAALPRAWMSYRPVVLPEGEMTLQRLGDPEFDPSTEVILHNEVSGLEEVTLPADPPQVRIMRQSAGSLAITATTETAGILVISEWSYPGWRATLNGRRVPLLTANHALQALLLPAGTHEITLRFVPPDVIAGGVLAALTLLLSGVLAWRWKPATKLRKSAAASRRPVGFRDRAADFTRSVWLLVFILLIAFAFRIVTASAQELRPDEAFSATFSDRPVLEIVPSLIEVAETLGPFHYLSLSAWMQLVGQSEFALRYLSIVLGLLLLAMMFQFGRQIRDGRFGLLLIILMTPAQLLIWVSQDVRNPYVWTPFLSMVATLVLFRATSGKRNRLSFLVWPAYAVLCALIVYTHYYGVFCLLAHALFLLSSEERRRFWWAWVASGLVALLLFLPWPLLLWPRWQAAGHLAEGDTPELARHLLELGQELVVGSSYDRPSGRWLFVAFLALALVGYRRLRLRQAGAAPFLLGWLASAMLFMYLGRFQRATFSNYYISLAAPAWWSLVAMGLLALWQSPARWQRVVSGLAGASLLIASGLSLTNYYFDPNYHRISGYRQIALQIRRVPEDNDVFVANAPDPSLFYYLGDLDLPFTTWPSRWAEPQVETEAGLNELAKQYDRIWFVPASISGWNPDDVALRWLNYHTLQEWHLEYEKLSLRAYRPLHAVDEVMTSLDASLNGRLRLHAAFVTSDGVPADLTRPVSLKAGADVAVTLLWEAVNQPTQSYTVFVHLLDGDGRLIAQHDGIPLLGTRPTTSWVPGERLLDRHEFDVPLDLAIGDGILVVGLYHTETLERQLFDNGRDAIPIVSVGLENSGE